MPFETGQIPGLASLSQQLLAVASNPRSSPMDRAAAVQQLQGMDQGQGLGSLDFSGDQSSYGQPMGFASDNDNAGFDDEEGYDQASDDMIQNAMFDGSEAALDASDAGLGSFDTTDSSLLTPQDKWLALAKAGLGAMASGSPYAAQAIGQGGLVGIEALNDLRKQRALEKLKMIQQQQLGDYRKNQNLVQHQNALLRSKQLGETRRHNEAMENRQVGAPSPLGKLQAERDALIAQFGQDDPRIKQYDAAIAKTTTPTGMSVEVGPDGTIRFTQGAIGAGLETKANRDEARANIDFTRNVVGDLDKLIDKAEEDPTLLGAVGSARRGIQTATGVASDIAQVVPGVRPFIKYGQDLVKTLLDNDEIDKSVARDFFDPNLSDLQMMENTIAIALAKNRQPTGRLLSDVLKAAKEDAKLTGLRSSADVIQKMKTLRGLMARDMETMENQLKGSKKAADMTDEEIRNFLSDSDANP